jgi:S-adenosylmethionine:tRNA ribosyltransferase-isomerase
MRGLARDAVKLMVIDRSSYKVSHSNFLRLADYLRRGDLLVFNASRTIPAVLDAQAEESRNELEIRLAERLTEDTWRALLLCRPGEPFACSLKPGMSLAIAGGLQALVLKQDEHIPRLWDLKFSQKGSQLTDSFYKVGRPVRYDYVSQPWPLDSYQTIYATEPGSAEMPSAGRAFTWRLLFELRKRDIKTANIILHTGLSSYMDDDLDSRHPASEEEFFISSATADLIKKTKMSGGRVIAVGTTVVRALESAANTSGHVDAMHGYTRLHIEPAFKLQVVDGLLTGLHEPQASHLDLLSAFVAFSVIKPAYEAAVKQGYLWHEFGDLNLIV